MKYAAININLDSFGEAYGFPKNYSDPTFSTIMDRFFRIADKWGFKYSIYVIGKDLEVENNRKAVATWAEMGHEIGNHSWSHPLNLGSLSEEQLYDEIKRSHDMITETIGKKPSGFIAPGWSSSSELRKLLASFGYEYDTSTWPSLLMYPALLKNMMNLAGDPRSATVFRRKDLHYPLFARREAHIIKKYSHDLVSLPLPTNKWRISCWHTTSFIFGWNIHKLLLRSCLRDVKYFYYLTHPADLAESGDTDSSKHLYTERMQGSLSEKEKLFEMAIEEIVNSGRKLVTMQELCQEVIKAKQFPG
jgi:peptidoglycan/xylan/chitin deacetylase (PgdA/CDA1 family)